MATEASTEAALVDAHLTELTASLAEHAVPLTEGEALLYVRAAYAKGYVDVHTDHDPGKLLEEIPMLSYPALFLP